MLAALRRKAPAPSLHMEVHRQPAGIAADWMDAVAAECRRHAQLCPAVFDFLKSSGLIGRCVFLAADAGGPLTWRYVGEPTVGVMGREWVRRHLGRPFVGSERVDFDHALNTSYTEAMDTGEVQVNRVELYGLARPLVYLHSLIGWQAEDGRRAVLSCVQL